MILVAACVTARAEESASAAPQATTSAGTPADISGGLDRTTLLGALTADLAAHYALTDSLSLDLARPWTPPIVSVGDKTPVVVSVAEYPEALTPALLLRVRYLREKSILKEETLVLRASVWRDSWVAAAPLKRGEAFSTQGLELRRVDSLRDKDALPPGLSETDYVLARDVPAGRPLTWRDVARRALVRRGQLVEVQASDGALIITMKALAMQDAGQGENVRVRNIESKREFVAKVVAENRAEVRF